jgi:hypothetical protein
MTSDTLKKLHVLRPFVPLEIHLADGRSILVSHPEQLAYGEGRTAVVFTDQETFEFIDLLLVASITQKPSGSKNGKRRQR